MVQNRYFLISLGLMLFYTVYQIILGIDLTYYCQYVMNDVNLVMPLSMAEKIPMIFIILLLPKLIPKYGKEIDRIRMYSWNRRTSDVFI